MLTALEQTPGCLLARLSGSGPTCFGLYADVVAAGLAAGVGIALNARRIKSDYRTYVLLGDGECAEGSVWEAAMFASHHRLNNLVSIIDHNGLCATDFLHNCLKVEPLKKKWEASNEKISNRCSAGCYACGLRHY